VTRKSRRKLPRASESTAFLLPQQPFFFSPFSGKCVTDNEKVIQVRRTPRPLSSRIRAFPQTGRKPSEDSARFSPSLRVMGEAHDSGRLSAIGVFLALIFSPLHAIGLAIEKLGSPRVGQFLRPVLSLFFPPLAFFRSMQAYGQRETKNHSSFAAKACFFPLQNLSFSPPFSERNLQAARIVTKTRCAPFSNCQREGGFS